MDPETENIVKNDSKKINDNNDTLKFILNLLQGRWFCMETVQTMMPETLAIAFGENYDAKSFSEQNRQFHLKVATLMFIRRLLKTYMLSETVIKNLSFTKDSSILYSMVQISLHSNEILKWPINYVNTTGVDYVQLLEKYRIKRENLVANCASRVKQSKDDKSKNQKINQLLRKVNTARSMKLMILGCFSDQFSPEIQKFRSFPRNLEISDFQTWDLGL